MPGWRCVVLWGGNGTRSAAAGQRAAVGSRRLRAVGVAADDAGLELCAHAGEHANLGDFHAAGDGAATCHLRVGAGAFVEQEGVAVALPVGDDIARGEEVDDRRVFKFKLAISEERAPAPGTPDRSRIIPSHVKLEVWKRDAGACVVCGSADRSHHSVLEGWVVLDGSERPAAVCGA